MSQMPNGIAVLESIAPLSNAADAWISDIWGVLHNGLAAFPDAGPACLQFRKTGGTIVLVTNAPRPAEKVARMLDRLGLPREAYDAIITSGDVSRSIVAEFPGRKIFHLGPERDLGVMEGLDATLSDAEDAEVVLCTGLFNDESETPDHYRPMLEDLSRRDVTFICANPDLMVERGPKLIPCAGALAQIYQTLGGRVLYAGKPHAAIYERAYAAIEAARGALPSKDRILAIGDGLRTDIEGAGREGLACVFIASALHVDDRRAFDAGHIAELFANHPHPPKAAMRALRW
ncbi:MAG: TIGR01459 family HAD-type hydrolase [Hyphomicrobiaceae bacterium]